MQKQKINKQKTERFRKILTSQIEALHVEIEQDKRSDKEVYADFTDVASAETDAEIKTSMRNRNVLQLRKINEALARLDAGYFGVCMRCEDDITELRLKARPTTTHCIQCQSELERENRAQKYMV